MSVTDCATKSAPFGGIRSAFDDFLTPGRFALLLAALLFAAFGDVVLGWRSFYSRDFSNFGYPLAYYVQQSYRAGEIPLWNHYNFAGLPFLAQWNTLSLYPLSLSYVILPLPWSLNGFNLLHLHLGGLGMYCLARRWVGSNSAAGVAGIGYGFGGTMISSLMWPNNIAALGWLPYALLAGEQIAGGGLRKFVTAVLVLALQFLTGAPEIIGLTWAGLAALVLTCYPPGRTYPADANADPQRCAQPCVWKRAMQLAALFACTLGLAAAQLFPFLELLSHSQRGAEYSTGDWVLGWPGLANFLIPLFRTVRDRDGIYFQPDQQWITSYYSGAAIVFLAGLALLFERNRRVILLSGLAALSLALAMGSQGPLYGLLRNLIPGLGIMRYPIKFILPAVIILPILAAYGTRALLSGRVTSRVTFLGLAVLVLIAAGALACSLAFRLPGEDLRLTAVSGATSLVMMVAVAALFQWTRKVQNSPIGRWLLVLVLVIIFVDLFAANRRINPVADTALLTRRMFTIDPPPEFGQGRVMVSSAAHQKLDATIFPSPAEAILIPRAALMLNANLLEHVPKIDGFFSLYLPRPAALIGEVSKQSNVATDGLRQFLGVSLISESSRPTQWETRNDALPMLTLVSRALFLDSTNAFDWLMSEKFKPREHVILPPGLSNQVHLDGKGDARILTSRISAHRIEATVETDQPALLVIAQADYPGWKATVDGAPVSISQANYAFQATEIPAGRHEVRIVYQPRSFWIGLGLSLLVLLSCGLTLGPVIFPRHLNAGVVQTTPH